MFYKDQSDNTTIFVNNLKLDKVDKQKESKTTPNVNVKISAYDEIVQLVTKDNTEVKSPREKPNKKSTCECLKP